MAGVKWKKQPEQHDYPAAAQYLSLLVGDDVLRQRLVGQLEAAPLVNYLAKDLLRASALPALGRENAHVARDLKKIRKGERLSPVLLVRGDLVRGFPLQVADGYHRVCASLLVDEDTVVPCRLIDLPRATPVRRPVKAVSAEPSRQTPLPQEPPVVVPAQNTAGATGSTPPTKSAPAKKAAVDRKVAPVRKPAAVRKSVAAPVVRKSTTGR